MMTNSLPEPSAGAFQLLYKEQWLCFAAFSKISEDEINQRIGQMDTYIEDMLNDEKNFWNIPAALIPENRDIMPQFARNLTAEINWHTIIPHFNYQSTSREEEFEIVGYFLIRLIPDSFEDLGFDLKEIRPNHLEYLINLIWDNFRLEYSTDFYFDNTQIPYSITISSGNTAQTQLIPWTEDNCEKYKKEIAKWADIYSGDFEDYKENFYDERIRRNLSNRTSEMHIILRYSALIYLDNINYQRFFIQDERTPHSSGYIYFFVLKTICSFHTIKFTLFKISQEIDKDALLLVQKDFVNRELAVIRKKLDKTGFLKESLDVFIKPFLTDSLRNQRKHYARVQQCCTKMYSVNENLEYIQRGIENNLEHLNTLYREKQNVQSQIDDEENSIQKLQNFTFTLISLFFGTDLLLQMEQLFTAGQMKVMDYVKLAILGAMFVGFVVLIIKTMKTRKHIKQLRKEKL